MRALLLIAALLMAVPSFQIAPGGRHVRDVANGTDWLFKGNATWYLLPKCTLTETEDVLDDLQGKGFNSVLIEPAVFHVTSGDPPLLDRNGNAPFTSNDFDSPVEAYWSARDAQLDAIAAREMMALVTVSYEGFAGATPVEGWYDQMVTQGAAKCRRLARFLANRWAGRTNLIWVFGGDRASVDRNLTRQIAYGVGDRDTGQKLGTHHSSPSNSSIDTLGVGEAWAPLTFVYAPIHLDAGHTHTKCLAEYARSTRRPFFLGEGTYEGEHSVTAQQLRAQVYWALTSGACGHFMGNLPLWNNSTGWETAVASTGHTQMGHAWSLFGSKAWHKLVPDAANVVATSGIGTLGASSYCTFARTPDASLVIGYVPTATSPVIQMSKMRGPTLVRRYNPTSGAFTTFATDSPASGTLTLTHPGSNGNANDWVWILEA